MATKATAGFLETILNLSRFHREHEKFYGQAPLQSAIALRTRSARTASGAKSSAELLDRAADLTAESAMLVHDNERRWRVFRARVESVVGIQKGDEG